MSRFTPINISGAADAVTDGTPGIGYKTVKRFEALGATVVDDDVIEPDATAAVNGVGSSAYCFGVDVSERQAFEKVRCAIQSVGPPTAARGRAQLVNLTSAAAKARPAGEAAYVAAKHAARERASATPALPVSVHTQLADDIVPFDRRGHQTNHVPEKRSA